MHVRAFAITGIDLTPVTVWIDDDGAYFGSPGRWSATMRAGWESVNDTLFAIQLKAEDARYARFAATLARRPSRSLAIEHVRLFDSQSASLREDQTVVVEGAVIARVGPAGKTAVPAGAERVDGRGRTLLPGLFGAGWLYMSAAVLGGGWFVHKSIALVRHPGRPAAMANFFASLIQLTLLLTAVMVEPLLAH